MLKKATPKIKKILHLKIDEITSFKTIIETLAKIVSETVWTIHNPIDKKNKFTGVEISTVDSTRSIFVKIQIDSSNFVEFESKHEMFELGINLEKLNKMIKFVEKNDIINMFLIEEDLQCLMIDIEMLDKKGTKILKFPLIDLEENKIPNRKIDYEKVILTTPNIFKKIFKDNEDFENVKINCTNKDILFTYSDDTSTEIKDQYILNEDGINIENFSKKDAFIGIYPISKLILFTKCTNLCEKIRIYMKNKDRLVVKLLTMSFGTITISLPPISEENIKNVNYNYSDDEEEIEIIDETSNKLLFYKRE
jgi:DNA polymerase III sliding clamp (beta) subunit (PCNA family)